MAELYGVVGIMHNSEQIVPNKISRRSSNKHIVSQFQDQKYFLQVKQAHETEEINKNVMCLRKQKLGGLIVNPQQFYIEVVVRTADQETQGDSGERQYPGSAGLKQVVQRAPLKGILLFSHQLRWECFSVIQLFFLGLLLLL